MAIEKPYIYLRIIKIHKGKIICDKFFKSINKFVPFTEKGYSKMLLSSNDSQNENIIKL
jgi:hypothetical protein